MSTSEAFVQFQILEAYGAHPLMRLARINTGKAFPPHSKRLVTFGVPGTADIVGILKGGRMVQIECKSAKGKQRKAQEVMQRVITEMGGLYIVARSLEEVDRAFAALGITR